MKNNIEHRLYEIEMVHGNLPPERKIILTTKYNAFLYMLKGYRVFDFYEKLGLEPDYFNEEKEVLLFNL